MMCESSWDGCEFGVTTVSIPTGVAGFGAQILLAALTELALPAGMPQPRDPYSITSGELIACVWSRRDHLADHLVTRDHPGPVHGKVPFGHVKVCAAHPTRMHGDKELSRFRAAERRR